MFLFDFISLCWITPYSLIHYIYIEDSVHNCSHKHSWTIFLFYFFLIALPFQYTDARMSSFIEYTWAIGLGSIAFPFEFELPREYTKWGKRNTGSAEADIPPIYGITFMRATCRPQFSFKEPLIHFVQKRLSNFLKLAGIAGRSCNKEFCWTYRKVRESNFCGFCRVRYLLHWISLFDDMGVLYCGIGCQ